MPQERGAMRILNRAAFVVTPKEPYLRWAASLGEDAPEQAQDLANEVAVYLVPEISTGEGETPPLGDYFEKIFAIELEAWSTDESGWPALRDFKTFTDWFDVQGESLVMDLGTDHVEIKSY
jgi:hypothetical protein